MRSIASDAENSARRTENAWSRIGGGGGGGFLSGILSAAAGGFAGMTAAIGSSTLATYGIIAALGVLVAIMAGPLIASFLPITLGFVTFGAVAVHEISKVITAQ